MRNAVLAILGLFAVLAGPASATDLGGSTKDPVDFSSTAVVNWTGFYIGAQAGGNFTVIGDENGSGGLDADGAIAGGRVGFDIARGRFLFGVFGDYNWSNAALEIGGVSLLEKDHEWSAGARAGMIVAPRTLVYVLGAFTQAELSSPISGDSETFDGWTAGAGVEFVTMGNIALGMEASHTWYDESEVFGDQISLTDTRIMGTLKVKLNSNLFGN